jgi:sec-independent protein translocase protein TatA
MGEFSIFHWMVVLAIILIFFGGKRIPEIMKGFGEGIRSFKEGMSGASHNPPTPPAQAPPAAPAQPSDEKK